MFSYLLLLFTLLTAVCAQGGSLSAGAKVHLSMQAAGVSIVLNGKPISVDFSGGIDVRVAANPKNLLESAVSLSGFRMTAKLPSKSAVRAGGDGETITIEQSDVDVTPGSLLKMTQQFPPKFEQIMVLSFTMTIDQPDLMLRKREPLVLTTKDPAILVGKLTQFPPMGDIYQLQNPIDLVLPDNPDTTIATIEKFPVKVGGL
ncbi:hypothetical protein GQ42DRAFT_50108 [Ramicandelaber brevisporus]|nr:hypothetical protein GQ42DRAFT_50108 [Ramicandelaber brevisporus]